MMIDYWEKYYILNLLFTAAAFLFFVGAKKVLLRKVSPDLFFRILLKKTHIFYLFIAAVYTGFIDYDASVKIRNFCDKTFMVATLIQISIWGKHFIEFSSERYFSRTQDGSAAAAINLFNVIAKFCMYVMLFLLLLHNLNVNITTLVTGLGVGGIAIALAVQNILGDLFASMTIVLDKPFVVGDSINVDNFNGTIEHIGMKTTRLRSADGEQLIFSNTDLLKSRIRNFKRMSERRVSFTIGVTYETSEDKLLKIPEMISDIIRKHPSARLDRSHFVAFADSALNFETVYWIIGSDFKVYRDTHQQICFEILKQFNQQGIGFAYPTQTVFQYNKGDLPA